ncbi:MAG: hypothetical protein F4X34_04705 [Chloroflexi bacterium]|nr:hypothetical protein [Chloroflexota bacterium]
MAKRVRAAKKATSERTKSTRDTMAGSAAAVGDSRVIDAIRSAGGTVVEGAAKVASRGSAAGNGAATRSRTIAREGLSSTREKMSWDSVLPEEARNSVLSAVESSRALSADAKWKIMARVGPVLGELFDKGKDSQAQILSILQGLLATSEGSALINTWLQEMVSGRPTIYDRAMDAAYNATRIGGGDHRLFDGGHSLVGAFQAVREASPDDSVFEEAAGLLQALARDATTPRGLPLVTWDQDTFNGLTDSLSRVGIPREWVIDTVSYDAAEVIGASVGVLALALNWNSDDVEQFAQIVGGMGLSAVVGANPLLLVVTVVALAKAYHTARKTGDWKEFADGLARGGICTGAVILATSMVGGPAVVVLLTGICVGVVAQRASQKVSIIEVGQWVAFQLRDARAGAKLSISSS